MMKLLFLLQFILISHTYALGDLIGLDQENDNFFCHKSDYNWNFLKLDYSQVFLGQKKEVYDFDKITDSILKNDFTIKKELQTIFQRRMEIHSAIGKLVPSLRFKLDASGFVGGVDGFLSGLLGFIVPGNWLSTKRSHINYEAEKLSFYALVLDEVFLAKMLYIEVHNQLTNYEITNFYLTHLRNLNKHIAKNYVPKNNLEMHELLELKTQAEEWENLKSRSRGALANIFLVMARTAYFQKDDWFSFRIAAIKDFPIVIPSYPIEEKEEFVKNAFDKSIELKYYKKLIKLARYDKRIGVSNQFISDENSSGIGVNLSYDAIPTYFSLRSKINSKVFDFKNMYFDVHHKAEHAVLRQIRSFGRYRDTVEYVNKSKINLSAYIDNYLNNNSINYGFSIAIKDAFNARREINNSLHDYLISQALQKRISVTPLWDIIAKYETRYFPPKVPHEKSTRDIRRWFRRHH